MNQGFARYGRLRVYDFRSPDKFSKEQLRTLLTLHENFARVVTTSLSALLRTNVQVSPSGAEQSTYSDFVKSLQDPTVLAIISLAPFPSNALMELDTQVAFSMIDRLLGGPGQGVVKGRAITDIEAIVMRRVLNTMLESMGETWRNIAEVMPRLEALETNPLFAQLMAPAEIVANIIFSVQVGVQAGELRLCLPYAMLEPVLPQLSSRQWALRNPRAKAGGEQERLARKLAEVSLPISVELGRARVTVGELLSLEAGDVIQLDTPADAPVDVFVKGRRKFRGKAGTAGRRLAVQVVEVIREGE